MRVAVGFATCGRPDVLPTAIQQVLAQTRTPDRIIICHCTPADITTVSSHPAVTFIQSPAGLPRQRNAILAQIADCDLVVFFDDDFLAAPHHLEAVQAAFCADENLVAATGLPLADGVKGPGISVPDALAMIAADDGSADTKEEPAPHVYGCNMALRLSVIRANSLQFDERLPLYAWSEDIDFAHRIKAFGRIAKLHGARGVHLGTKSGRSSGRRLGYSQVANPLYLRTKGSYSWRRALGSVARNLAANGLRAAWSEPYIDRRGRLLGNAMAFMDLLRGRLAPERVLDF